MDKIIIIGGGGHAKVLISIIKCSKQFEIIGYTDINNKGDVLGIKYLGGDSVLESFLQNHECDYSAIGIGKTNISNTRKSIITRILKLGFEFPVIISPNAVLHEDVLLKRGTMMFDGAVINSGTSIGEFCIINTNSTVEHDCKINNFVHIAPGATLGGGVEIGENSIIGLGANILPYKKIAADCIIGAGATVTEDCNSSGTYLGIPAKKIS